MFVDRKLLCQDSNEEFLSSQDHFLLQSRLCSPRPVTELKTVEQDEHVITRPDGITTFSFFFSFLSFFFSFLCFFSISSFLIFSVILGSDFLVDWKFVLLSTLTGALATFGHPVQAILGQVRHISPTISVTVSSTGYSSTLQINNQTKIQKNIFPLMYFTISSPVTIYVHPIPFHPESKMTTAHIFHAA